jgi:hypothetical protein
LLKKNIGFKSASLIKKNSFEDVTRVQNQVTKILESDTKPLSTSTTKSIEAFEHLSNIQSQEYIPGKYQQYDNIIYLV